MEEHGRSRSRHDGGGRERVGEGREGVLVRVLVRVLVLVLVLVELGPQVGWGAQGGPARMYMSITQLPPFLHLYTAFLVMLLLKKPLHPSQVRAL